MKDALRRVGAISHVVITVGDRELYDKVLHFYMSIGFKLVSHKPEKYDSWMFYPPPGVSEEIFAPHTEIKSEVDYSKAAQQCVVGLRSNEAESSKYDILFSGLYGVFRVVYCESNPVKTLEESHGIASLIASDGCDDRSPLICLTANESQVFVVANLLQSRS